MTIDPFSCLFITINTLNLRMAFIPIMSMIFLETTWTFLALAFITICYSVIWNNNYIIAPASIHVTNHKTFIKLYIIIKQLLIFLSNEYFNFFWVNRITSLVKTIYFNFIEISYLSIYNDLLQMYLIAIPTKNM